MFGIALPNQTVASEIGDVAQAFALRLKDAIRGYSKKLEPTESIVVMGLDSATPGRMAITFYRELKGSEFLARIEAWHMKCAWSQNFGKDRKFVGAPAPRDIAEATYGRRLDDKLRKVAVERFLPCIVDGAPLPRDLVESTTRRASNRLGFEDRWEWEKCLGIACALFKGSQTERDYQMTLETDRRTRDYLYGRLLAIAERIESVALGVADEKQRDTSAARMMQRFADRPYSTWRTIELALTPYKSVYVCHEPHFFPKWTSYLMKSCVCSLATTLCRMHRYQVSFSWATTANGRHSNPPMTRRQCKNRPPTQLTKFRSYP
ncbi:type I-C CRISPR-associated protein Cas8c/Csd1 [Polaromonas sp. P1-6]|nr:type I-C CRISPR-associated protein Cas8c/Csd1 [Polaromonas sp. P1-6]